MTNREKIAEILDNNIMGSFESHEIADKILKALEPEPKPLEMPEKLSEHQIKYATCYNPDMAHTINQLIEVVAEMRKESLNINYLKTI